MSEMEEMMTWQNLSGQFGEWRIMTCGSLWLANFKRWGLPHGMIWLSGVEVVGGVQLSENLGCRTGFWWSTLQVCANKIWGCISLLIYSFSEFLDFGLIL